MAEQADIKELERDIREGTEYLVIGIIMPIKQRYAEFYRGHDPRVIEDEARTAVAAEVHNGQHGELWVAGVVEHEDGRMKMADQYACFVDPDEVPSG